jgi:hypothetical protein
MPTQIQWRRGNTAQTSVFTGAVAEITVDTTKNTLVVHDGVTPGGHVLALENQVANSGFTQAAFNQANTANTTAQAGFNQANTANTTAQAGFNQANTANVTAQAGFNQANAAYIQANSAFAAANNVAPQVQPAYDHANAAFEKANTNPLSPYFPTFPLGLVTENMYTALGEHIDGLIYDMRLVPDGNLRIVDAGTI